MRAVFDQKTKDSYNCVHQEVNAATGKWEATMQMGSCREVISDRLLYAIDHFEPGVRLSLYGITRCRPSPRSTYSVNNVYYPIIQQLHITFGTVGEVVFDLTEPHASDKYGSITGIPGEWLQSQATVSFIIYLARMWAYMENHPHLLGLIGKTRYCPQRIVGTYATGDWGAIIQKLLFPTWYFAYGKESFWLFLYTIFQEHKEQARELLIQNNATTGFSTWAAARIIDPNTPEWFTKVSEPLYSRGSSALGHICFNI